MTKALAINLLSAPTEGECQLLAELANDSGWPADTLARAVAESGAQCWVARHAADAAIIGFCLVKSGPFDADIEMIAVAPRCRRQGIAQALLAEACRRLATQRCERLLLEVRASNHAAIRLYERYGFILDGRRKGYYPVRRQAQVTAQREDALLYSLSLVSQE